MLPETDGAPKPALVARWIRRNRAALEATATITLAMSAPVIAAVATIQTA